MSKAVSFIEENKEKFEQLSDYIWANPEPPYRELLAQEATAKLLEEAGFTIERGIGDVKTALRATWGEGHPVIGYLGEYDPLPGMSQKITTEKEPIIDGGFGHGCGHNLLGTALAATVIGVKEEMMAKGLKGTLVYYGCPAEELLTGKVFMARAGAFQELDIAYAWHPSTLNAVNIGKSVGLNSMKFHFKGRTAHAGGDPHNGRSALDAVELTNVGANYLREHVTTDVRIHYVITEGGTAPNIVPDKATVWYYVRAPKRESIEEVYNRLVRVAEGAAHMTETQLEVEFMGGCYPSNTNHVLAEGILRQMEQIPVPTYTEEEYTFAKALNEANPQQWEVMRNTLNVDKDYHIADRVMPLANRNGYGSSDVGDVAHICPTSSFGTACYNIGAPGHSWNITSCSGHSIGRKGMIYAAKVLAAATIEVLEHPEMIEQAKVEFKQSMGNSQYNCPIPAEVPVP